MIVIYILFVVYFAAVCLMASDLDAWAAIKSVASSFVPHHPGIRVIASCEGTEHETIIGEGGQEKPHEKNPVTPPQLRSKRQEEKAEHTIIPAHPRKKKRTGAGGGRRVMSEQEKEAPAKHTISQYDDELER